MIITNDWYFSSDGDSWWNRMHFSRWSKWIQLSGGVTNDLLTFVLLTWNLINAVIITLYNVCHWQLLDRYNWLTTGKLQFVPLGKNLGKMKLIKFVDRFLRLWKGNEGGAREYIFTWNLKFLRFIDKSLGKTVIYGGDMNKQGKFCCITHVYQAVFEISSIWLRGGPTWAENSSGPGRFQKQVWRKMSPQSVKKTL